MVNLPVDNIHIKFIILPGKHILIIIYVSYSFALHTFQSKLWFCLWLILCYFLLCYFIIFCYVNLYAIVFALWVCMQFTPTKLPMVWLKRHNFMRTWLALLKFMWIIDLILHCWTNISWRHYPGRALYFYISSAFIVKFFQGFIIACMVNSKLENLKGYSHLRFSFSLKLPVKLCYDGQN